MQGYVTRDDVARKPNPFGCPIRCTLSASSQYRVQVTRVGLLPIALIAGFSALTAGASAAGNLPAKLSRMDSFVLEEMRDALVPGMAIVVTRNGETIFAKGYGEARPGIPVDQNTAFVIGSISKGMTAMGLMTLVEQGKIDPAAPVLKYLPGFRTADSRSDAITVNHVLSHTSGFSTRDGRNLPGECAACDIAALIEKLSSIGLSSAPGERFEYSNLNYLVAGAIIETVSGETYAAFMREHVFLPMGMTKTVTTHLEAERESVAIGSRSWLGFNLPGFVPYPVGAAPAGEIVSTARDMGLYLATIQKEGLGPTGQRLLSPRGIATITSAHHPAQSYGYGWFVEGKTIFHAGDNAEFHANVYIGPYGSDNWGVAILCAKNDYLAMALDYQGSFQSRILWGVYEILTRGSCSLPSPHGRVRRSLLLGFAVLLVALCAWSLLSLRAWMGRRGGNIGKARIVLAFVTDIALPISILVGVPVLLDANWSVLRLYAPDIGWIASCFALLQLAIGMAKAAGALAWALRMDSKGRL